MLRERIFVGGVQGTGKTYDWLTIARAYPESKFYVIDPDDGTRRVWYNEFKTVSNIEYYFTPEWYSIDPDTVKVEKLDDDEDNCYIGGIADAWATVKPKLKKGDWLIVEHLGNIWATAQTAFVSQVFNESIGKYFLEARKSLKDGSKKLDALQGWTDWSVINKIHNEDFIVPVCFKNPAHLYMTTSISVSSGGLESPDIKEFYGDTKIRFNGQKENPYRAQTMILKTMRGKGKNRKYYMDTFVKDRGRDWMEQVQVNDFALQYLCGIAGWD